MPDYTKRAKKIIENYSQAEAMRLNCEKIEPEHLFLGIFRDPDSIAMKIMTRLGVNFDVLKKTIDSRIKNKSSNIVIGSIPHSQRFSNILKAAEEELKYFQSTHVGTEHLLLALFNFQNVSGVDGLIDAGITYDIIKEEIEKSDNSKDTSDQSKKTVKNTALKDFTSDLTEKAINNLLDPVIGRELEIERLIRILSRKTKNNPVLIGEAGVGKTAIVEGLAQCIISGNVPDILKTKKIYSIDMAGMVAGTKYRGEFEERFKKIIQEIKNNNNAIIFIDELHTITGAGAAEGALDAANIIKPFLARSEIQCIGATTLKEYRKYIEKDPALERRFQTIIVREPDENSTLFILQGLSKSYETHHKVHYTEKALIAAVKYSIRYIRDRYLPDKAIDIIDEAGAKAKIDNLTFPTDLKLIEDQITNLNLSKKISVENQNFENAAKIRDEIIELKTQLKDKTANWENKRGEFKIFIDEDDIKKIISQWTHIPLEKINENESLNLLNLESTIKRHIIGQDEAVSIVCRAIRRSRAGLKKHNRPIGSFIFTGPTGVGKTELAKILSDTLFGNRSSLIRIDMSEYMEKHAVSRLIGAPPGYIGFEEGGQLTDRIKRNPYSIILFDEIEKAHPDIYNILLQILDEGELTDSSGTKISFRDCIIIMTSNIGNTKNKLVNRLGFSESNAEEMNNENILEEVKSVFNPEFINRIDEIVLFKHLVKDDIQKIVSIMLDELNNHLSENNIFIQTDDDVITYLTEKGYDFSYGARYLKRLIQTEVEDPLSEIIISHKIKFNKILLRIENEKIVFKIDIQEPENENTKKIIETICT